MHTKDRAQIDSLQVAERLLTVAVGFIPRPDARTRRVAERRLKIQLLRAIVALREICKKLR